MRSRPGTTLFFLLAAASIGLALAETPRTADLPAVFNGRDLTGWTVVGAPYWRVVDGTIVGESDEKKQGSMLYTERSYGDVIVEG